LSGVAIAQLLKGADYYKTYDWNEEDGRNNLGDWIVAAAQQAER
jgi:hypothetical protein